MSASSSLATTKPQSPVANVLSACKGAFAALGVPTGAVNVLMLAGSLFMLQA